MLAVCKRSWRGSGKDPAPRRTCCCKASGSRGMDEETGSSLSNYHGKETREARTLPRHPRLPGNGGRVAFIPGYIQANCGSALHSTNSNPTEKRHAKLSVVIGHLSGSTTPVTAVTAEYASLWELSRVVPLKSGCYKMNNSPGHSFFHGSFPVRLV
jgi:hypothetical protein